MPVTRQNISGNAATATKLQTARTIGGTSFDGSANITPDVATKLAGSNYGTAPHYAVRAFVAFNGTGTLAIITSKNVASVTDNGVGNYTVNMSAGILDNQYASWINGSGACTGYESGARTATALGIQIVNTAWSAVDSALVSVGIIQ